MPKTDVVFEVLYARIPFSSQNPMLAELRGNKPCLKVLTKSDLADEAMTLAWQEYWRHFRSMDLRPNGISDARHAKPRVGVRVLEVPLGRSDRIPS